MNGWLTLGCLSCAIVGLALCRASLRLILASLLAMVAAGVLATAVDFDWPALAPLVGTSAGILVSGACIYLPQRYAWPPLLPVLAFNAGFWALAAVARTEAPMIGFFAVPLIALSLPARWLVKRNWKIALNVAASWILAVTVLAVTLNTVSMPSTTPDHMQ